jgi:hypothetical protein
MRLDMRTIDELVQNYINHAKDDYFGLWVIADRLKQNEGVQSDEEVKEKTLLIAQKLMQANVLPGVLADKGSFNFWSTSPADSLVRMAIEWPQTGIPTLASGNCWFALKKS